MHGQEALAAHTWAKITIDGRSCWRCACSPTLAPPKRLPRKWLRRYRAEGAARLAGRDSRSKVLQQQRLDGLCVGWSARVALVAPAVSPLAPGCDGSRLTEFRTVVAGTGAERTAAGLLGVACCAP
jgi:hypothetical protein